MLNIKEILKLKFSKKERYKKKKIIVEGFNEVHMALKSKFILNNLIISKNIFKGDKKKFLKFKKFIIYVSKFIYNKIAYRKNNQGIIGIFKIKKKIFLKEKYNKFLILENIEKPGNLGSIIRSLESVKIIDCIIIVNYKDLYNPNIIRASLGCVFIYPIFILSFKKILKIIKKKKIYLFGTSINKKKSTYLYKINFNKKKFGIIFGNEHNGISKIWYKYINKFINIPMFGRINSLNVSVSVSIIVYEILRQFFF
ncbi:MAG: RNA methyltransferase [Candidatus Shikimatogenerans bostrichidophilus]|nr:MAG: RNA methyltransferase [Candidatus Shikimatogenerans bostrichidophilus]